MRTLELVKFNYITYLMLSVLGVWMVLFGIRVCIPSLHAASASANQVFENIIHVYLIIFTFRTYVKLTNDDKVIFKWFILTNIFFFLNDIIFYLIIYLPGYHDNLATKFYSQVELLLNNIPFLVWLIAIIIFLSKILIRDIVNKPLFFKILFFLIVFNLIVITLFLLPVGFHASTETVHNIFLVSGFIIESIIFDLAMLCLVYSKNRGVSLILSGFVVVITGDFLITYCWLAKIETIYGYGSLLWFLGMILIFWGALMIDYDKSYNIKSWFRGNGSIKSRVTFWAFSISATSFLLFFIIADGFSFINRQAFIALPVFIMFYSIFVISLSAFMGRIFEVPFKKIEGNINTILINSDKDKLDANFSIDEFIFLQKVIVDAFKSKEEQDLIRKQFGDLAAEVAHDVASPLTAMHSALSNLKKNNVGKCDIAILEKAMQSVKNITNNLLINYRSLNEIKSRSSPQEDDGNTPRYIMLAPFLANLIENKQLEWSDETCNLYLEIDPSGQMSWLYVSPQLLTRVISNLLNNAYESLDKEQKDISCKLLILNNNFQIDIQDNGGGIPQEYIQEVVLGKSLKHPGSGMGLSGAKKYLTSINGGLDISSIHKEGTCVSLNLPIAITPSWFSSQISCNIEESSFVVLDDDPSIIMLWQRVMTGFNANCKYFLKLNEFDAWFNTNNDKNIIFLIDYDIRDTLTGIDIIQKYGLLDVYMFTNHAEELWLQELVVKNKFKLVPKSIISSIQIIST